MGRIAINIAVGGVLVIAVGVLLALSSTAVRLSDIAAGFGADSSDVTIFTVAILVLIPLGCILLTAAICAAIVTATLEDRHDEY